MAISINHDTYVISIPKADTVYTGLNAGTGYELRTYDEYAFMRQLADYLDSEAGIALPNAYTHNTTVTISGVAYARALVVLAPYTITFEAGTYQVKLNGGMNNNLLDVLNPNSVSVIPANSAGLQQVSTGGGGGTTAADVWAYGNRTLTSGTTSAFATPLAYKAVTNNQTASDPGAGKMKWNNATQNLATQIYMDVITDDGIDLTNYLKNMAAGAILYVQDKDDAGKYQRWTINLGTDNTGWITFNVALIASAGGNIANNAQSIVVYNNPQLAGLSPEQMDAIAAATLAAAQVAPIHSNVQQMNDTTLLGTGVEADKWRGNV